MPEIPVLPPPGASILVQQDVDDYVLRRGSYADDPRYWEDCHAAFLLAGGDEAKWPLFVAEGRVEPGGPLMVWPEGGDRIVPRTDGTDA